MPNQLNILIQSEAGNQEIEKMRRALISALTNQAERYRVKARELHHLHTRKPDGEFDVGAKYYLELATLVERMRDQIKEG